MSFLRTLLRDERGGPGAEMALMLPLLMALLFGGMEGGFYFWREHQIVKAAREAARYGSRLPMTNFNCTDGSVTQSAKDSITAVVNASIAGTTTTTASTMSCISGSNTGLYVGKATGAPILKVSLSQNYGGLFSTMILPSGLTIGATAQSAVMGL